MEPVIMRPDSEQYQNKKSTRVMLFWALIFLSGVALSGCGAPAWKTPEPLDQVDFKSRSVTLSENDLVVTVAVPTRHETEQIFGTSLYSDAIQPVWVEVRNNGEGAFLLNKPGMDDNNFSALEVSYQRHSGSKETRASMDKFFRDMSFQNPIDSGEVVSGFVFTHIHEGYKAVNIDLVGRQKLENFSFVVEVPGLLTHEKKVDFDNLYDLWTNIDSEDELRRVLESLPCCTTSKNGKIRGDPLNIVMIGNRMDIFSALIRRGWAQSEVTYSKSAIKTMKSFVIGAGYLYSPISPLYVYERVQDLGLQKSRSSINRRNHMRLWRTPYNFRGEEVYIGQISRDIGVKFSRRSVFTHAIDPDVDDTRDGLAGDMAYSQALAKIAWVKGSQRSTVDKPHYNLTPDLYLSDGNRIVLFFAERPRTLSEIKILEWEQYRLSDALK